MRSKKGTDYGEWNKREQRVGMAPAGLNFDEQN